MFTLEKIQGIKKNLAFIIPSLSLSSTKKGELKSLTGGKERIDVLARCLLNLIRWQKRLIKEVNITLIIYLSNEKEKKALFIELYSLRVPIYSEIDALKVLIDIINSAIENNTFQNISFSNLIETMADRHSLIIYLKADGTLVSSLKNQLQYEHKKNIFFILGSQDDLTEHQEETLKRYDMLKISIGEKEYLASQVITIIFYSLFVIN